MKRLLLSLISIVALALTVSAQELRVLAIGNSFSQDVVEQHLHELAEAQGVNLIIGHLYIGGCHLQKHLDNLRGGKKAYGYRKIGSDGKKVNTPKTSIQQALLDEKWDYIMLQQVSGLSGVYASFGKYLPEYMERLRDLTSKDQKFLLMQTWAYQSDSEHYNFAIYNYDQATMYKAVVKAYDKVFKDKAYGFHALVPNGTAIQNGRTYCGDTLTRDGFHLDKRVARYLGSCTMCEVLTGKSVIGNSYKPKWLKDEEALIAQKAAHAAVLKPNKVTKIK